MTDSTGDVVATTIVLGWAQPRVRADGRKRASLACGSLLPTLVGRRSTRALGRTGGGCGN